MVVTLPFPTHLRAPVIPGLPKRGQGLSNLNHYRRRHNILDESRRVVDDPRGVDLETLQNVDDATEQEPQHRTQSAGVRCLPTVMGQKDRKLNVLVPLEHRWTLISAP